MGEPQQDDNLRQSEIAKEQRFVDKAYEALDAWRELYRDQQAKIAAQISANPSARADRDALAAHYGDEAARLESVENHLVFGRLDMENGAKFHIGRVGLRENEEAHPEKSPNASELDDALSHQLLIDWRAKASRPFYQATAIEPMGVAKRRHLGTELRQVVSVEDELLNVDAADETTLQGEGALMAALSKARGGRMHDIVSTIQAEQDRVIRTDLNAFLVVQGGPGTGKTAVALHRAAYLLYAHRDLLDSQGVLVIGPSKTFLRYIERVLPALGETGVVSETIGESFPGVKTVAERPSLRVLKGDTRWIKVAAAAVADLKRPPTETQELILDHVHLTLPVSLVKEAMEAGSHAGSTHNQHWAAYAKFLVRELTTLYGGENARAEDLGWMTEEIRTSPVVRHVINQMFLPASAPELLERLYAYPQYLERIVKKSGVEFHESELQALARPKGSPFTDSDVPILDELAELLGPLPGLTEDAAASRARSAREVERAREAIEAMDLGGGLVNAKMLAAAARGVTNLSPLAERARKDRTWAYGHVVVDEAQELTPMDWHLLLRRCPSRSFTVVGDLNQARDAGGAESWEELLGPAARANPLLAALTINYRTPERIMTLAENVLSAYGHRMLVPSTSARDLEDCLEVTTLEVGAGLEKLVDKTQEILRQELALLEAEVGDGAGKVAVITNLGAEFARGLGLEGKDPLDDQSACLSPQAAKGLEFDVVILVEPAQVARVSLGDLYVAMTRPTRRLHIVKSEILPGLDADV
ncbi:MAG: AAA family ATPase [Mobiluncus sp.]|uniref:HelD family protein n=1 Tax=Mobiluncus sp. TaxID=47293 RepID=UPI00258FDE0F|nr:AAA family ATPase [Mobiluncus sp.]MCI6584156.1 AAA family ATPase [Mobiluncus sp.]